MTNEELISLFRGIREAQETLRGAFRLLDGTDGATEAAKFAFSAAIAAMDAMYESEWTYYDRYGWHDIGAVAAALRSDA